MVIERYGTPDALQMKDVPEPTPKPNEVLVRVRAASINDWDWGLLTGTPLLNRFLAGGLFTPQGKILGCDVAGRVEAVGAEVTTLRIGDEVYGDLSGHGFGAFAEYVCAPEEILARKPASMTFEQAAAIPQAGMLAVQGLIDVGRLRHGQRVLLNGAGGGVGTFALQIAKLHDTHVTAVDRADKLAMLRTLGADHVIDYETEDFTEGEGRFDLILDVKTTRSPREHARVLNPGGAYVTVGGTMWRISETLVIGNLTATTRGKRMHVVMLKPNKDIAYLNGLFEAGQLTTVIEGPYPLADLREAFRLFESAGHKGKIVITME